MANVITKTLMEKYLRSLAEDEDTIEAAAEQWESAKAALDVGLRRYIALRDFVTERLGESPYAPPNWAERWPPDGYDDDGDAYWRPRGRFRFTGMSVGDAVLEVLRERRGRSPDLPWMSLASIIEELSAGGLGFPEPVQARAVNAALLKTSGVKRGTYKDGSVGYSYDATKEGGDEPPVDPDDLPFE